jgi:hypothetical protein
MTSGVMARDHHACVAVFARLPCSRTAIGMAFSIACGIAMPSGLRRAAWKSWKMRALMRLSMPACLRARFRIDSCLLHPGFRGIRRQVD